MDSIHTVQTEALHSRTFCHQRSDEQEGRTDRYLAPGQEGGSEEQEGEEPSCSPWLQTGLYLSPGLFRIFSSCLWLKLDTPMDLVSPASSHFSRAWEGGVVNSREQSLGMGNKTRLMAAKKKIIKSVSCQELALIIRKKKGEEVSDTRRITVSLEKPQRRYITWKEIDTCLHIPKLSSTVLLCQDLSNGFLPHNPSITALRFMNCCV